MIKNPLNRAPIRLRLLAILVAFAFSLYSPIKYVFTSFSSEVEVAELELKGARYAAPLLQLLNDVADYQMSKRSVLAGRKPEKSPESLAATANARFDEIAANDKATGADVGMTEEGMKGVGNKVPSIAQLQQNWESLRDGAYNAEKFNQMQDDINAVISHVSDVSGLNLDPDADTYYIMNASLNLLPKELGVLAKLKSAAFEGLENGGNHLPASEDKNIYPLEMIISKVILPDIVWSLEKGVANDKVSRTLNARLQKEEAALLETYKTAAGNLSAVVNTMIHEKEKPVTPEEFIGIADEMHDGSADLASTNLEILSSMLEDRIADIQGDMLRILVICGLAALVAVILYVLASSSIIGPIGRVVGTLDHIAAGNVEAKVEVAEGKNEFATLWKACTQLRDNLKRAKEIETEAARSKVKSEQERKQAMLSMASSFESSVGSIVNAISSAAGQLQMTAQSMSETAEETTKQSNTVAAASEESSSNVQTVASAAEELSASVGEIQQRVAQSTKLIRASTEQAEQTNNKVKGLQAAAEKIGAVVQLINDIAGQTNLLALNATIEAARAGDAGKGFAVVASEVKNLAAQTAKATDEIAGQIKGIQDETAYSVEAIQKITSSIEEVNKTSAAIAAAVEEQGSTTQEIARNVNQAAAGASEVALNIVSVSRAAQSTGAAAEQVLSAADELAKHGDALKTQVNEFLKQVRTG